MSLPIKKIPVKKDPVKKDPPKKDPPKKDPPKGVIERPANPSARGFEAFISNAKANRIEYRSEREASKAYETEVKENQRKWDQSFDHGGAYHAKGGEKGSAAKVSKGTEGKSRMNYSAGARRVNKSHSGLQSPHDMSIKDLFNL